MRENLIGEKMSGESDENFEGMTKIFPDEKLPRHFIIRPNFYPIFLSPTETFTQNFTLKPKIKSKFLHSEYQKLEL